jgi:oxygen-independent coproporphyrinogen-3 oxidase
MLMGLRLKEGLDLKNDIYKKAYLYFKNKLKYVKVKNNYLLAKNLNTIDNILLEII